MSGTKTLAVIGASEETVAHLRLLMKLGARQLHQTWVWGEETAADFVAVEVHDLGAQGVLSRCQSAGVPCAVMAEADEVVVHGLVLRRPFKLDQIVAVLNAAGADSADAGDVEAFADDFYTRDLDDVQAVSSNPLEDDLWTRRESGSSRARVTGEQPVVGLDELIHGDPLIEPEKPKPLIYADTTLQAGSSEPTKRSEGRADQSRHRVIPSGEMPAGVTGVGTVDVAPILLPPRNQTGAPLSSTPARSETPESAGQRLIDLLEGDRIASPTQVQLPDLPTLILDPKKRAYHAEGNLAALDGYARQVLPRTAIKVAGTVELNRVRETQPARAYDELRWLAAMAQSNGRLASRLDPGGTFQVAHPVHIDPAFHAHGAIAAALAKPARLHEIAAASKASMEQVFDVVSAYDAIARLTWTPRQRLAAPEPAPEPSSGSALSRLKWPFGKK